MCFKTFPSILIFLLAPVSFSQSIQLSYTVDRIQLSHDEMVDLCQLRADHFKGLRLVVENLKKQVDNSAALKSREYIKAEELPEGEAKEEILQDFQVIDDATLKSIKYLNAEIQESIKTLPGPKDIRQKTIAGILDLRNPKDPALLRNRDENDTLDLEESQLPDFIFSSIDTNNDTELSLQEVVSYNESL